MTDVSQQQHPLYTLELPNGQPDPITSIPVSVITFPSSCLPCPLVLPSEAESLLLQSSSLLLPPNNTVFNTNINTDTDTVFNVNINTETNNVTNTVEQFENILEANTFAEANYTYHANDEFIMDVHEDTDFLNLFDDATLNPSNTITSPIGQDDLSGPQMPDVISNVQIVMVEEEQEQDPDWLPEDVAVVNLGNLPDFMMTMENQQKKGQRGRRHNKGPKQQKLEEIPEKNRKNVERCRQYRVERKEKVQKKKSELELLEERNLTLKEEERRIKEKVARAQEVYIRLIAGGRIVIS